MSPDDKNPELISLTGRQKVLTQIAPMFTQAILKKWERKTPPTFPQTGHEKGVETGKGAVDPRKIVTTHASFVTFITFFPVALKNCQFLAALPSVDGCNVFQYLIPSYYFSPQVIQGIRL